MTEFKPVLESTNQDIVVSINVSAKNIGTENFAQKIKQMIDETQFPAEHLEIEITEYSFAESMETTIDNILTLRTLGVQIALDDFGTGYTSIAQLMKLPVNLLKIDTSIWIPNFGSAVSDAIHMDACVTKISDLLFKFEIMAVPILARIVVHGFVKAAADIEHRLATLIDDTAGRLLFMGQPLQYPCNKLFVFQLRFFIPYLVIRRQQHRHVP